MKVSKSQFSAWKNDPITKQFFKALKEARDNIEELMISSDIILSADATQKLTRLVGNREGIDLVLTTSIEDYDDEDESSETSRVSSTSEVEEDRSGRVYNY